jgi:L-erythro-3,5-diaminohexanoate dehydrogenase
MKVESPVGQGERIGADRVLSPAGSLPQPAERLDASAPVRPHEVEIAVERLCLDATSYRDLRDRAQGDPAGIALRIRRIVGERGKMHNPATDSGGILLGAVSAVGDAVEAPPEPGERVATLASLTLTPLRLDAVERVDPASPQVEVRGTAYVTEAAGWAPTPGDVPVDLALAVYDVCAAASQVRELAPAAGTVCVLGAGHAGKIALAAARDAIAGGTIVAVDRDPGAAAAAEESGLADVGVAADLRDPVAAAAALREAGVPPADLTVSVVSAEGCEPAALLLTADGGTVLFFSMATSFQRAALACDGIDADVRMVIGSGRAPDRGAYAIDLVRRSAPLRRALGLGEPA